VQSEDGGRDGGGHEGSRSAGSRSSGRSRRSTGGRNERGELPLHRAARRGDVRQTKKLIKDGADVNCRDYAGLSCCHVITRLFGIRCITIMRGFQH